MEKKAAPPDGTEEVDQKLFNADQVYQMPDVAEMGTLGPAAIIKHLAAYLSEEEGRPALRNIMINANFAEATDGRRFIRIPRERITTPIPNGVYRPVKDGKSWLLIAVAHQMELPNVDGSIPHDLDQQFERDFDPKGSTGIATLLYYLAKRGTCVSHMYLEDIPCGKYTVNVGMPDQLVLFLGDYTVGIMPIKP